MRISDPKGEERRIEDVQHFHCRDSDDPGADHHLYRLVFRQHNRNGGWWRIGLARLTSFVYGVGAGRSSDTFTPAVLLATAAMEESGSFVKGKY